MTTVLPLLDRTFAFAQDVRSFTRVIKDQWNVSDVEQVIRSSGSVAANYIEACEAISTKDFYHRIKICKKESRESMLWMQLLVCTSVYRQEQDRLIQEAKELVLIFNSIVQKRRKIAPSLFLFFTPLPWFLCHFVP